MRFGRARNFVDERPLDMIDAQLTGVTEPSPALDALDKLSTALVREIRAAGRGDRHQGAGLLALGPDEVLIAIDTRERGDRAMRPGRQ